jgi:Zn-dependent protease
MFRNGYRLPFRLAGIPLYLDISFLLILPLMVWMTAQNIAVLVHQPQFGLDIDPGQFKGLMPLALGLFSVIGLFVSIVLHELGHSITAQRFGVKVRRITLWFLGGVAEFEEMPRQRGAEAIVGIAGPIVSFIMAGIFWGLTAIVPRSAPSAWIVVWYLGMVNLMLGLFNLLPAMPLDGGRILRSLLALKMPHARATVIAGNIAKVIAIGLGIYGLFANLWLIVLAFFIFNAARSETRQSVVTDLLRDLGVGDLMSPYMHDVPPGVTISHRASALDALTAMAANNVAHLIVLDDAGAPIGILTQGDLMRAIQIRRMGLQVASAAADPAAQPSYIQRPAGEFHPYPPPTAFGYTPADAARDPQRFARPL